MRITRSFHEQPAGQQGLMTTAALRADQVSRSALSRAVARGEVVRVRPAVYAARPLPPWPVFTVTSAGVAPEVVAHARAVLLSLGDRATAGLRTAACLRGWELLAEPRGVVDVAVLRGRGRVRLPGVRVLQRTRVEREAWCPSPALDPLWTTSATATALDCARTLPLRDAVVVCDSALRSGQVTLPELEAGCRGLPGAVRARRVLALCDPESGSVLETVLRLHLVEAGITGWSTQQVVLDQRGRRVLRVDLCFPEARLVVEADGSRWHQDPGRDRWLDNRLAAAGWRVLRLTWAEVLHDPVRVVALVRDALASGSLDMHGVEETRARAA